MSTPMKNWIKTVSAEISAMWKRLTTKYLRGSAFHKEPKGQIIPERMSLMKYS
jgi:hypothetical protein